MSVLQVRIIGEAEKNRVLTELAEQHSKERLTKESFQVDLVKWTGDNSCLYICMSSPRTVCPLCSSEHL